MSRSTEVTEAVGEADESLEHRADRLRQVVATPSERDLAARELLEVETQIADRDRAALREEAEKRVLGIRRALGSVLDQLEQDGRKAITAAKAFETTIKTVNERYEHALSLRHEGQTLAEVFGINAELPAFTPPANRPDLGEAFSTVQQVRVRDHGSVNPTRDNASHRTFEEVELAKTPGLALIRRKFGK